VPPEIPPAIFHLRNRALILVTCPAIALICLSRILESLKSGDPWLNWLAGLVLWLLLFFLSLRRRLVLAQDWLEYTESFTTLRVAWDQVLRVSSRRALGVWSVEGLEIWTTTPGLKQHFIELTQFDRAWRQADLGRILRAKLPHLFQ